MGKWLDEIEVEARERLHVRDEHMLEAERTLRLVRTIREVEAALEKIINLADFLILPRDEIRAEAVRALGHIARSGDEQP